MTPNVRETANVTLEWPQTECQRGATVRSCGGSAPDGIEVLLLELVEVHELTTVGVYVGEGVLYLTGM